MKKILLFGGVSYNMMIDMDEFPDSKPQTLYAKKFHETIGSTGAGKSVALKKLGLDIKFHGIIGEDKYGELIKEHFRNENIPFFYDIDPNGTERHVNLMKSETGERISIFLHYPPKCISLNEQKIEELIKESDIILLNIAPYCKRYIPLIQKYRKEIWCDLHSYDGENDYYDEFIDFADVIMCSSERYPEYMQFMKRSREMNKKMVICTHGVKGSTVLLPNKEIIELSSLNYKVVDSNGAGDNFLAGLLYGYVNGLTIEKSLKIATIVAGLSLTSKELVASDLSEEKVKNEYNKWFSND
jgi:sugar/nucleoside kinase (ribokinase family)